MSIEIQFQALHDPNEAQRNPREIQIRNFGRWTSEEQLKYVVFLELFKDNFKINQKRQFFKIFKMMGEFINTRDGIQCRSHHMKQLKSFKKVSSIVRQFKKSMTSHTQVTYNLFFTQLSDQYSCNMPHCSPRNAEQQGEIPENTGSASVQRNIQIFQSQSPVYSQNYASIQNNVPVFSQDFYIYMSPSVEMWQQTMRGLPYITYNI